MINAPRVPTVGSQPYQMYQVAAADSGNTPSKYGPMIVPNNFADLFFEKAVISFLGGVEIEPSTQTHQTTKVVHMYTTDKPEEALFKYQNLGVTKTNMIQRKRANSTKSPLQLTTTVPFQLLLEQITRP